MLNAAHRFFICFFLLLPIFILPADAAAPLLCSGISLRASSKILLIPFSQNRTQVFTRLKKAGLHIMPDPQYQETFVVNESPNIAKLPVAYLEFSPSGKILAAENIIPTATMGDAKNLLYKIAEQYRRQITSSDEMQANSSGSQYKIFASCGKTEIQMILSISYESQKKQYYVSVKTIL